MSIRCSQCEGNVPELGGVVLNVDGDFACSESCARQYRGEMARTLDRLSDPTANLADVLGLPACLRPLGEGPAGTPTAVMDLDLV